MQLIDALWQNTTMVYSLLKASSIVDKSGCVVSYGDIFYEEFALQALLDCPNDISILYSDKWTELWKMRSDDPLADAETFQLNSNQTVKLTGTRPESLEEIEGQYMGVLRFKHLGWKTFTNFTATLPPLTLREISMTSVLNSMISHDLVQIGAVKYSGAWGEVDTESDLKLYNSM